MITLVVVAVAVSWSARWVLVRRRSAAVREAVRQLPQVAADLARSVRSGSSMHTAFGVVSDRAGGLLGPELRSVAHAIDRGRSLDAALGEWQERTEVSGVDLLVGACRFGVRHGGDLTRALDGVAAALLDALEVADETRALVAQARTSAAVLLALPPLGAALFALADPAVAGVLLGSTAGWLCVVVGLGLDALGALVSGRIIGSALR